MATKRTAGDVLTQCTRHMLRHKLLIALLVLLWAGLAASGALPVILVERFVDALTAIESRTRQVSARYVYFIVALTAAALLLRVAFEYFKAVVTRYLSNCVAAEVREKGMEKYLRMSLAYFDRREAGDAVLRLSSDTTSIWRIAQILCEMVEQPVVLVGVVAAVFVVNWKLALIGMIGLPVAIFPVLHFSRRIRKYARRGRRRYADIAKMVVQVFGGMRIVIGYGQESDEARRFGVHSRSLMTARMKAAYARAGSRAAVVLIAGIGGGLVMIAGAHLVMSGLVKVSEIVAVTTALGFMRGPLKSLVKNNSALNDLIPHAERILEILEMEPDMVDDPDAVEIDGLAESIAFEDISFRYDRDFVLQNVSFTVPAGGSCAIVGPSGVGKSSLLNLVPRFYDPTSGRVLVDGRDVRKIRMASLRRQIAIVTQETFLFNTSVAENIRYGRPGASDEEVEAAARAANVHDEIAAFPEGYATQVGDRGVALSGGQRQRVAIARAVLRGAPILILDEATSSLDSVAEREVQAALDRLVAGRTTLVVAHRLSTISGSDMIVVLRDGRVEAIGRHEEVLGKSPTYGEMWEAQQHRPAEAEEAPRAGAAPLEMLAAGYADAEGGEEGGEDGENARGPEDDDAETWPPL